MKIHEIIQERVSSVVYHATQFSLAEQILKTDILRHSPNDKSHGISFTRSLTGDYHLGYKIIGVIFEFDGDLLNQKNKGAPVGTENFDSIEDPENTDEEPYLGKENKQLEDRLYVKGGIQNVTTYIKNAILFLPKEFVDERSEDEFGYDYASEISHIPNIVKLLESKKISYRYVSTVKELFNKTVNNKQGFLEVVVNLDKQIAGKLGLNISNNFDIDVTVYRKLPKGELNDHTGEDIEFITLDPMEVSADSPQAAYDKAKAYIDRLNKDMTYEKLNNPGDEFFEIYNVIDTENNESYEVDNSTGKLNQ